MAQLGARFHGMEEVIGSIPIRSTNHFKNLDNASALGRGVLWTSRLTEAGVWQEIGLAYLLRGQILGDRYS